MDKNQRLKALAGYKDVFDIYLSRPMTPEEQKIYDDCIDCKISLEEYKDNPECSIRSHTRLIRHTVHTEFQ